MIHLKNINRSYRTGAWPNLGAAPRSRRRSDSTVDQHEIWVRVDIMVLPHTFGGDLKFNSPIHLLVSAGGLNESKGLWIPHIALSKVALMRMWRYAVISHLRLAFKARVLESDRSITEFHGLLSESYESGRHLVWIILIERLVSKARFLRFAAWYVRRPECDVAPVEAHQQRCGIRRKGHESWPPGPNASFASALFTILSQARLPRPARLSWRRSRIKYFGINPMIDNRGQEMHRVRREGVVVA
jgi:hypothetical protein